MNLDKYQCIECNKEFFVSSDELSANYCPYCSSDDIQIIEDFIEFNYKKEEIK